MERWRPDLDVAEDPHRVVAGRRDSQARQRLLRRTAAASVADLGSMIEKNVSLPMAAASWRLRRHGLGAVELALDRDLDRSPSPVSTGMNVALRALDRLGRQAPARPSRSPRPGARAGRRQGIARDDSRSRGRPGGRAMMSAVARKAGIAIPRLALGGGVAAGPRTPGATATEVAPPRGRRSPRGCSRGRARRAASTGSPPPSGRRERRRSRTPWGSCSVTSPRAERLSSSSNRADRRSDRPARRARGGMVAVGRP